MAPPKSSGTRSRSTRGKAEKLPASMYDDAQAFQLQKNALAFGDDSGEEIGSDDDAPVLGLGADEDSEYDSDEDEGVGKLAKISAAQKAINRQIALSKGEDDEDQEDDDEEEDARKWGSKKNVYYNAEDVDVDFDSDDEAAAEEGEEALRMQKEAAQQMLPQDLGLDDDDDDDDDGEDAEERTLGAAAKIDSNRSKLTTMP